MIETALAIGFACVSAAVLLNVWRLVRGPDLPDRIIAVDTLYINTIARLMLVALAFGNTVYFEAALLIALLGFVSTVALFKFVLRGDIIE